MEIFLIFLLFITPAKSDSKICRAEESCVPHSACPEVSQLLKEYKETTAGGGDGGRRSEIRRSIEARSCRGSGPSVSHVCCLSSEGEVTEKLSCLTSVLTVQCPVPLSQRRRRRWWWGPTVCPSTR